LREGILALLALFALISMAVAEHEDGGLISRKENNMTFSIDQKVSGAGFFSTYRYALMPDAIGPEGRLFNGVESKNQAHASGVQDMESLFSGESTYVNESTFNPKLEEEEMGVYSEHVEVYDDYEEETTCIINLKEDNILIYSPISLSFGTMYYNRHPLAFKSLIKDGVCIKNRDGFGSLNHAVENAHALNKLLDANSDGVNLSLNVEEDLKEGKSHFGALQLTGYPRDEEPEYGEPATPGTAMKLWQKSQAVLDEDYIGSFHIKKNMTLTFDEDDVEWDHAWLPCCSGGYLTMPIYYRKGSKGFGSDVEGVFNCTCSKVPKEAQFQGS
jgi:hypothetical protein